MPPRKVKVVSMGAPSEEPSRSTLVVLNDVEEVVEEEHPEPPVEAPPPSPEVEAESKPLIDSDEIDDMINEVRGTKDAFMMAALMVKKKQDEREECIHCGKTLSKKSLKYSHAKTCKGLQPGDIQVIPELNPEDSPEPPPPPPEPVKMKKPRAKAAPKEAKPEVKVEEPVAYRAKTAAEILVEQREQRRELRHARISLLASQAF